MREALMHGTSWSFKIGLGGVAALFIKCISHYKFMYINYVLLVMLSIKFLFALKG